MDRHDDIERERDDGRDAEEVVEELMGCDGGCNRMLNEGERYKRLKDSETGDDKVICMHCWEDLTRGMIE